MKTLLHPFLFLLVFLLVPLGATAQTVRLDNNRARRLYLKGAYQEAYDAYKKADAKYRKEQSVLQFGMATALLSKGQTQEAAKLLEQLTQETQGLRPEQQAAVWHNTGNIFMAAKDYPKAIEAYKQSLRLNPTDDETRYNLTLAMKLNKQNNQGGGGAQDNSAGGSGSGQNQPQGGNQPQDPAQAMDQEQAQKILDAYRKQEDQTRRRLEQPQEPPKSQREPGKKNW